MKRGSERLHVFGDPMIANRVLHHSVTINIKGESYRLKEKGKARLLKEPVVPLASQLMIPDNFVRHVTPRGRSL